MLKKLFYVGLGISIIVAKKSVSYILAKKSELTGDGDGSTPVESMARAQEDILAQATADIQAAADDALVPESTAEFDDLTVITGIGPTYAKRLKAAGIGSFSALSQQSPERINEVAKLRGQTTEAASWISQAAVLAA